MTEKKKRPFRINIEIHVIKFKNKYSAQHIEKGLPP